MDETARKLAELDGHIQALMHAMMALLSDQGVSTSTAVTRHLSSVSLQLQGTAPSTPEDKVKLDAMIQLLDVLSRLGAAAGIASLQSRQAMPPPNESGAG